MINFCNALVDEELEEKVDVVFYDSQAYLCTFEFAKDITHEETTMIYLIAKSHIGQFEMYGMVDHKEADL